jgi:hypothetical protein
VQRIIEQYQVRHDGSLQVPEHVHLRYCQ